MSLRSQAFFITLSLLGCGLTDALAADSGFLADRHAVRGLGCVICHETKKPDVFAEISARKCLSCHESLEALAARTDRWGQRNPHKNHLGEVECAVCHKGHQPSASYCLNCHRNFEMPM